MDDPVEVALRRKKDSSMRVAINLVKDGARRTPASRAGNTGALMAISRYRAEDAARHRPAGDRHACCRTSKAATPTCSTSAPTSTARAEHLLQFARHGQRAGRGGRGQGAARRVGLLNIGEEEIKGNEVVKQAAELLRARRGAQLLRQRRRQRHLQGHDRHRRLRRLRRQRRAEDLRRPGADAGRLPARGIHAQRRSPSSPRWSRCRCSTRFEARVDPRRYNGASLLGLRGIVVKSHGSADAFAFEQRARARAV